MRYHRINKARKAAALLCALLLCALPVLSQAEGLLGARLQQAEAAGRQVVATLCVEAGEGLELPPEMADAVKELLDTVKFEVRYVDGGQALDLALLLADQPVLTVAARVKEDGVELETSLLPGKTLWVPMEYVAAAGQNFIATMPGQNQNAEAVMEYLTSYFSQIVTWAFTLEGAVTQSETPVAATDRRDAAASSTTVRLTPEQIQSLLIMLAETFADDTALQEELLASSGMSEEEMREAIQQELQEELAALKMSQDPIEIALYADAEGESVGADISFPSPFADAPFKANLTYDRLSADDARSHVLRGDATWGLAGELKLLFSYASGAAPAADVPGKTSSVFLNAMLRDGQEQADIQARDERVTYGDEQKERFNESFTLRFDQDFSSIHLGFTLESETEALTGEDFASTTTLSVLFGGQEMALLHWALASQPYEPATAPGGALIDLSKLSESEMQELSDGLQNGLQQLAPQALPLLPESSLQLLQGIF